MPQAQQAPGGEADRTRADATNASTEKKLDALGVTFKRATVQVSKLNERETRKLQTRPRMLQPETVEQYALDMRRGAVFPAAVVIPLADRGSYAILSGNHTHAASRRISARTLDAYEVARSTPSEVLLLLGAALNRENGLQVPEGWRMRQAVSLLAAGLSRELVSEHCGLSMSTVSNAERAHKAATRAARLGLRRFEDLPVASQAYLGTLIEDAVFVAMARTVITYLPPPEDETTRNTVISEKGLMEAIRAVRSLPSEDERLKYVGTWASELEARVDRKRRGVVRSNPKANFVSAAGKLLAVNPTDLARLAVNDEERETVMDYCERVVNHLALIEEALR